MLARVYTCENATLFETTCHGLYFIDFFVHVQKVQNMTFAPV